MNLRKLKVHYDMQNHVNVLLNFNKKKIVAIKLLELQTTPIICQNCRENQRKIRASRARNAKVVIK